jgi:phage terminase large subunit GpA-like protein
MLVPSSEFMPFGIHADVRIEQTIQTWGHGPDELPAAPLELPPTTPGSLHRGQWDGGSLRMHWRCRRSAFAPHCGSRTALSMRNESWPADGTAMQNQAALTGKA